MPDPDQSPRESQKPSQFDMSVLVFGAIRPAPDLNRRTHRSLKAHSDGRDYFTDITLHEVRNGSGMRVEYSVTATSPMNASRAAKVYLGQLCDLLTTVTRTPVSFYMPEEEEGGNRIRPGRRVSTMDRVLTEDEWSWITGNLVFLRREHPGFLAATSWYRKALAGRDVLDDFCSYWRVLERAAFAFFKRGQKMHTKEAVYAMRDGLFSNDPPSILAESEVKAVYNLRNRLTHAEVSITPDVIESANGYLLRLEDVAFNILARLRDSGLIAAPPE